MAITVKIDTRKILSKHEKRRATAQGALDIEVLKDSNFYCPQDTGTLLNSGKITPGGGQIQWVTEYARAQYYESPNKSKDRNPNARMKWFESAKKNNKDKWVRIANAKYHE